MRHVEDAMTNRKLDRHKRVAEGVSSTDTGIKERRQQLAQQIGRLLAKIWLRRRGENQIRSSISESTTDPFSVSL
jgi:hypothetical protein